MTIEAVIWDFGGVLTTSPFEAFARFEKERGLPADIIRRTNAANHWENAWAKFERAEVDLEIFDRLFAEESLALGAEASFVARSIDSDRKHLTSVLRAASQHQGSAFVEIYQNCNIFNDNAFEVLKAPETRDDYLIRLEHGQPVTFGADRQWCVTHPPGAFGLEVRATADVPAGDIVVHDATVAEPAYAFALSRLPALDLRYTPIGVLRNVDRPSYDSIVREQVSTAKAAAGDPEAELASLLNSGDTWTIR